MQFQGEKPIFLQLAEQLEDGILSGAYPEGSQVPSITEYAATYKINPATALKGINQLVNAGLLYKKRGIGMFVAEGAQENLRKQRSEAFYHDYVEKWSERPKVWLDPRTAHRLDKERISRCPLNAKTLQNSLGAHVPWIKSPSRWNPVISTAFWATTVLEKAPCSVS